jgi:Mrp family chromosome partitioning ATPase/capsular polysaccharide biosynthesis protein
MTAGTFTAPDDAAEPRSLDLRECWHIVRRRWVIVLTTTLLVALAAAGYAATSGQKYVATSQVVVFGLTLGPSTASSTSSVSSPVNMSTEQAIAQSPPIVARAAKILGVPAATLQAEAPKGLNITIPATTLITSNVLQISWTAPKPRSAQAGANAFATAYLSYRDAALATQIARLLSRDERQLTVIQNKIAQLTGQVSKTQQGTPARARVYFQLSQLHQQSTTISSSVASLNNYNVSGGSLIGAALPTARSGLGHKVIGAVGVLLGLFIGIVLAFIRDAFDDHVREPAQLERSLGVPTLAVLPPADNRRGDRRDRSERREAPPLSMAASPDSQAADAVRVLRATLAVVAAQRNLRTILVVAADNNVSSSHIAADVGLALAESGRRVLLVAADIRGSALPQIFGLQNNVGLTDLLDGGGDPEILIRHPEQASGAKLPERITRHLAVLSNGTLKMHALSVLDSSAMAGLLTAQREAYDFVLLDAAPATVAADVFAMAGHVDGVIVVARMASTRGSTVQELRRRLDQVRALVIGGVLIGAGPAGRHRNGPVPPASATGQPLDGRQRDPTIAVPPPFPASKPVPDDAASSPAGGPGTRL